MTCNIHCNVTKAKKVNVSKYVVVKFIHNAAFYSQVWFLICLAKFFRSQELHYVA